MSQTYFQKGFGLKAAVGPVLAASYDSGVVERLRELSYAARAGDLVLRLAREFGFCYGVDRAVEYAYETRQQFPDRRVFLSGEIIHNPEVNARMQAMGIRILPEAADPAQRYAEVAPEDVVILPAFGVPVEEMEHLRGKGCVLVDTTCGSVLNVWKNVHEYARDGFTAIIHGKHYHEETKATASQALTHRGGHYLSVRDREEAEQVCAFIRGELGAEDLLRRFVHVGQPGLRPRARPGPHRAGQPDHHVDEREPGDPGDAPRGHGRPATGRKPPPGFRAMDTICSATQDRQDAVLRMLEEGGLDLMVVIGGYNSSNTQALARICAARLPTYHIDRADCIGPEGLRHRPVGTHDEVMAVAGCPRGRVTIGLTAGASTPNNVVGEVVRRLLAHRGQTPEDLRAA